jgi:hypothetical protein
MALTCLAAIVADTPLATAAAAKLPLSTTRTNIAMPASLSIVQNHSVGNEATPCPFIIPAKWAKQTASARNPVSDLKGTPYADPSTRNAPWPHAGAEARVRS